MLCRPLIICEAAGCTLTPTSLSELRLRRTRRPTLHTSAGTTLLSCWVATARSKHYTDWESQPDEELIKPEYAEYIRDDLIPGMDKMMATSWEKIAQNNPQLNIINASGGTMDCFPRMSVEEVIAKHD